MTYVEMYIIWIVKETAKVRIIAMDIGYSLALCSQPIRGRLHYNLTKGKSLLYKARFIIILRLQLSVRLSIHYGRSAEVI